MRTVPTIHVNVIKNVNVKFCLGHNEVTNLQGVPSEEACKQITPRYAKVVSKSWLPQKSPNIVCTRLPLMLFIISKRR